MTRLYRTLFCPPYTDDEQKDLAIQNRIRRLRWITPAMLDAVIDEGNPRVRELIERAQTGTCMENTQPLWRGAVYGSRKYLNSVGALGGLGFQSLPDCVGIPWESSLWFSSHI